MTPTINNGDDVLICRFAYWFREPHRGDLIVFETSGIKSIPEGQAAKDVLFVKRLIGLPNDTVEIGGGSISVNKIKIEFRAATHPIEYRNLQNGILPRTVGVVSGPTWSVFRTRR
jgi:signal peptidase I